MHRDILYDHNKERGDLVVSDIRIYIYIIHSHFTIILLQGLTILLNYPIYIYSNRNIILKIEIFRKYFISIGAQYSYIGYSICYTIRKKYFTCKIQ